MADPIDLLRCFAALPLGAELCNGCQHDCQEALRTLLDALHDDLVRSGVNYQPSPYPMTTWCARRQRVRQHIALNSQPLLAARAARLFALRAALRGRASACVPYIRR